MEQDDNLQDLLEVEEDAEDDDDEEDAGGLSGEEEADSEFISDAPAERSGHVAVMDRNCMYVWGGYKVSAASQ